MFLSPRWIASHVFVAALILAFIGAGFWQIDRLYERQDRNEVVEARLEAAPTSLDSVTGQAAADVEFLAIEESGRYEPERQILVANRSDLGAPGFWAWTLFVTDRGTEIIVNRGFVNRSVVVEGGAAVDATRAVDGETTITGLLRSGIPGGRLSGDGTEISRPDATLASSALGVGNTLDPSLYIELTTQRPPQPTELPRPVPPPELDEGPHRSYAFQWFTFATMGLAGYLAVLIRIRRGDQSRGDVSHDV